MEPFPTEITRFQFLLHSMMYRVGFRLEFSSQALFDPSSSSLIGSDDGTPAPPSGRRSKASSAATPSPSPLPPPPSSSSSSGPHRQQPHRCVDIEGWQRRRQTPLSNDFWLCLRVNVCARPCQQVGAGRPRSNGPTPAGSEPSGSTPSGWSSAGSVSFPGPKSTASSSSLSSTSSSSSSTSSSSSSSSGLSEESSADRSAGVRTPPVGIFLRRPATLSRALRQAAASRR